MIDTASVYRNEIDIGKTLKSLKINRNQLFITSKIAPKDQGYQKALSAIQQSLKNLQLDYLDAMLIHWPGTQGLKVSDPQNKLNRLETWKALREAQEKGLIHHVGVSNFTLQHLQELSPDFPFLNQIEFHPLVYNKEMKALLEFCQKNQIIIQSYATLAEGKYLKNWEIPELNALASKHKCTKAQILLQWSLSKGCPVIPKSQHPERLKENLQATLVQLDHTVSNSVVFF